MDRKTGIWHSQKGDLKLHDGDVLKFDNTVGRPYVLISIQKRHGLYGIYVGRRLFSSMNEVCGTYGAAMAYNAWVNMYLKRTYEWKLCSDLRVAPMCGWDLSPT